MKLYTKKGDEGNTTILGTKLKKYKPLLNVVGGLDELNSILGVARTFIKNEDYSKFIESIQCELLIIGAELGSINTPKEIIGKKEVDNFENIIDSLEENLPKLTNFILPGGTQAASFIFYARSICRRVERDIVSYDRFTKINPFILSYMNRLSDLLFIMGRTDNAIYGNGDLVWKM